MKSFGSFYALAILCASALGAALNPRAPLAIKLYTVENYHGTPHSVPFKEEKCTSLPRLQILSIRIPEDYDCFFHTTPDCSGNADIDAFDSIPDTREYTPVGSLHSFKCETSS